MIVELLTSPVSHQAVEKFAQAMETADVGLVSVTRERKDVTQENSVRSFQAPLEDAWSLKSVYSAKCTRQGLSLQRSV